MKKIPEVYVNKLNKINNNKEVYYSYKDNKEEKPIIEYDTYQIRNKINELFKSKDFIYKKKFNIKTKYDEREYIIISKSYDYLLTITGEKIYIDNILNIK